MTDQLMGKNAVITGAASGQGRATALAMAEAGARIIAADVDAAGLRSLVAELGDVVYTQICDVSDPKQVAHLIDVAEAELGGVDAMLNCAGFLRAAPILETTDEILDRMIGVNLRGVFYGCKYAIPALKRRGGGSIVNWGSVNSMVAEPDIAAYSATKGAVLMITKSVALEHARDDIRANCLCPGGVQTPMVEEFFDEGFFQDEAAQREYQPLGMISPQEIADVAVFLVSDASRKMTGTAVVVDAGYTAR
jgi:meso-butanediol dehydrogenase/(S,S)-butanediol dehydrogenase/diacetyl reductase